MAKRKSTVLVCVTVVMAAVATGLAISAPAWQDLQREEKKAKLRAKDAAKQEQTLADALRGEAKTKTAVGLEAMIRERGDLKKGEQLLPVAASEPR